MRQVINAIFYVVQTGCQWENLPKDHPNHNSVYHYYRKWCKDGTWTGQYGPAQARAPGTGPQRGT
jgi:putative transposase